MKNKEKHDKIVLLRKNKLNTIEVLISKAFTDSYITHDEFVPVNNELTKYNEMKEEIKKSWDFYAIYCQKQWKSIVLVTSQILKTKIQVLEKLNKMD